MTKATINKAAALFFTMILMFVFGANSFAQNTYYGNNVVKDGDFSGDTLTSNWVIEGSDSLGNISVIDEMLAFTELAEANNQYDLQINQPFTADQIAELAKGGTFEVTFDARTTAEAGKTFHVFLGQVGGDWARYWQSPGDGDVTVTNTMNSYKLTTDITQTWEAMRLGFEIMTDTSSLFIDNVVLRKVEDNNILYDGEIVIGEDSLSAAWNPVGEGTLADYKADNGAVKISNFRGIVNSYDVQFIQELDSVQIDSIMPGPYELSFDAKTEAESKQIQIFFGNNGTNEDYTNFAPTLVLDSVMTHYSYIIDVTQNWPNMKVGFEVSGDNSAVWFDNVILTRVTEIKPAAPTFSLSTADGVVTVAVNSQGDAASYDVYFSSSAIDSVDKVGVSLIGTLNAETGLSLEHTTAAPHPNFAEEFEAHYAVVAKTEKGTGSDPTSQSITTDMSTADNYAVELSTEAVTAIAGAFQAAEMPASSTLASFFPEGYSPFTIDATSGTSVHGEDVESSDLSSKHWIGFDAANGYLVIYAEVTDDEVVFQTEINGYANAWDADSWEIGIGNYTPESFVDGSSHTTYQGGAEPDWQLRGGGLVNTEDNNSIRGFIGAYGVTEGRINGEVPQSETLVDITDTGYRTLTIVTTVELAAASDDVTFSFPTGTEVDLYPFQLSMNDADVTARETQRVWGSKVIDANWWNTPTQWDIVAFVGMDAVFTSNEEPSSDQPLSFSLEQNYPNPFNPSTNINFTLPSATQVTLEVFNMLGQKVATLINNETMTVGSHSHTFDASNLSSGLYIYRISTGSSFVQAKKMMLIK